MDHDQAQKTLEETRRKNREKTARYRERHYERLKEKRLAQAPANNAANREDRNAKVRARALAEPEKERARISNRLALSKGAKGRITKADIRCLFVSQFNACLYCKADLSAGWHLDHRMPLSRGGAHALHNLQLLCALCNLRKTDKDPDEYELSIGYVRT